MKLEQRDPVHGSIRRGGRTVVCGQHALANAANLVARTEIVQQALEPVAEQVPERLTLPDAIDQPRRRPHAIGGQVHRNRRLWIVGSMGMPPGAEERGGARLRHRWRVYESLAGAALFARLQIDDPSERSDVQAGRARRTDARQPLRCQRGRPRVQPVGPEAERFARQPLERLRVERGKAVERRNHTLLVGRSSGDNGERPANELIQQRSR
jgi:hypothetical protein